MGRRASPAEVLRVYTAELPDPKGRLDYRSLAAQTFLENCAERLSVLGENGSTGLRCLEALTMSLDGLTYRLTLKKGLYFHCGAEVTANDAVDTILSVLSDEGSVSQLHHCVARVKTQRHGYAVSTVSRYRCEITLTRRMPDLLARLSLPEFSLRHGGKACFSGLWKIEAQDEQGFDLVVHDRHADAQASPYRRLRWERIGAIPEFNTRPSDLPYLYLYAGTQHRTPPEEMLTDEICRPLDAGVSHLIKVKAPHTVATEIRARIVQAAKLAFDKGSLWRRMPLASLVPKAHALHVAFPNEPLPAIDRPLKLALDVSGSWVPQHIWDKFRDVAWREMQLEIELGNASVHGAADASATVRSVYYGHPSDYYTPLAQFLDERSDIHQKDEASTGDKPSRRQADFCQSLPRVGGYAPFLAVPFLVRSNRNIARRETTGVLNFTDVKQSGDHLRKQRMQETSLKALGAGLQMFVHDVKRPFALVQGILHLLETAESPTRIQEISLKYLPDVRKTVDSVQRLIQDILEVGSDAEPNREDVVLEELIEAVLAQVFSMTSPATMTFSYRFAHQHLLHADPQKLSRVLSNLVLNASEAMSLQGEIWFETSEEQSGRFVQVTVGNTNSLIPKEAIEGLFDRFFTEGKKQGTGLGLAIVKKIVNDHGGEVWCESDVEHGTRFTLTVPFSPRTYVPRSNGLPRRGSDVRPAASPTQDAAARAGIRGLGLAGGTRVLLVDDDAVYMEMLKELLTKDERELGRVSFHMTSSGDEALVLLEREPIDVAIVDVDLGQEGENGFDVTRRLRARRRDLKICMHSNGAPFELQRRAIEAGADLFLPKPLSRPHLVRLLVTLEPPPVKSALPRIAVIDDDALMLETWESLPGYEWKAYASPADFLAALEQDESLLGGLACVVTDYRFPEAKETGVTLANTLVARRPDLAVFLATSRPMHKSELPASIRAVVTKDAPVALVVIEGMLGTTRRA